MRLTLHSDYALRTLIYLAIREDHLATIGEISEQYDISRNHMMKVVQELVHHGFIISERGRNGGLRLSRKPDEINLGEVVGKMEPDMFIVSCFDRVRDCCRISGPCGVQPIMHEALASFMEVLNRYSLADVISDKESLKERLLPFDGDLVNSPLSNR